VHGAISPDLGVPAPHTQPDSVLQEFENVLSHQDRTIVESHRPEQVPFDLAAELHLKFDAVAVAYRRAMHTQGLDYYHYLDGE
jgi:vanillate O-demethylase monooxygenase subunit